MEVILYSTYSAIIARKFYDCVLWIKENIKLSPVPPPLPLVALSITFL